VIVGAAEAGEKLSAQKASRREKRRSDFIAEKPARCIEESSINASDARTRSFLGLFPHSVEKNLGQRVPQIPQIQSD
jgi:hypothetical protein